jgi:hypothetical protein
MSFCLIKKSVRNYTSVFKDCVNFIREFIDYLRTISIYKYIVESVRQFEEDLDDQEKFTECSLLMGMVGGIVVILSGARDMNPISPLFIISFLTIEVLILPAFCIPVYRAYHECYVKNKQV